jgi:hypothetical protein
LSILVYFLESHLHAHHFFVLRLLSRRLFVISEKSYSFPATLYKLPKLDRFTTTLGIWTWAKMASAGSVLISTTSPQTASLKEDLVGGENYQSCTADAPSVEDWINEEFGEMEGSQVHHETDSLIYMAFRTQVDEYIDMVELLRLDVAPPTLHEEQAALFFLPALDEGLFYELDLWCFS